MKKTLFLLAAFMAVKNLTMSPPFLCGFLFPGTFHQDNDVVQLGFSVASLSHVTVFSSSWLEGNPPHGFDPILAIWTAGGALVAQQDDGGNVGTTLSNGTSYDHGFWDSFYEVD